MGTRIINDPNQQHSSVTTVREQDITIASPTPRATTLPMQIPLLSRSLYVGWNHVSMLQAIAVF